MKKMKSKKSPTTLRGHLKKSTPTGDSSLTEDQGKAEARFRQDLVVRGEAAELDKDGKLPSQATHILTKNPDGTIQVKRARFKLV